jgi:ABC-type glycerol-3-phosphate transport system substrate-binding protein
MKPFYPPRRGVSRRDFLKMSAGAAGAVALSRTISMPGRRTVKSQSDILNVYYWADSNESFQRTLDAFTEETGITVNYEVAPADYLTHQQLVTTRMASSDTSIDAYHLDDFQIAIYGAAGWLFDLDGVVDQYQIDLADFPQTLLTDVSSWDGRLYRIPWGNDTEIFMYRTDWFEEAGVQPPTTWDELLTVAAALTQEGRWGMALCGKNNGILGNDVQHWTNQAGGAINALDVPGARDALVFYKDLFTTHQVSPPSVPQEDYSTVNEGFLNNTYGMWWVWDGFLGGMRTDEDFWQDQVSAFVPPMGPENAQTTTACWGWSINGFTEKPDLASEWIGFISRPEIMKNQIYRGRVPTRVSLWSDPEVQELAPSSVFLEQLAAAGDLTKARPVTPSIQEIYDIAEAAVHAYLTDQLDVDAAIEQAMSQITPILERDMGG